MIQKLSLEKFDNNIMSLVESLKENCKLLSSCGECESSIIANILWVIKKYPNNGRFQDKYNNVTNIHLDNFMRNIWVKYESLVEDGQWDKKSRKGCQDPCSH